MSDSRFYPQDAAVPDRLEGDGFVVRPLTVDDCALDLDAMRSRPRFRELTFEDNRVDLERHEREHRDREAFTYTVMNADETRCLGCMYIVPLTESVHAGLVIFWVRPELVDKDFDVALFHALHVWLRDRFAFESVAWRPDKSEDDATKRRQAAMFAAVGLRRVEDVVDEMYA